MLKKTKTQSPTPTAANDATNPPAAALKSPKPAAKNRTTKAKTASTKAASKKKSARKTAKPKASSNNGEENIAEPREPSDADIRLRAYFIAERRVQLALQGDPALDWIEARQQLLQEARQGQL